MKKERLKNMKVVRRMVGWQWIDWQMHVLLTVRHERSQWA